MTEPTNPIHRPRGRDTLTMLAHINLAQGADPDPTSAENRSIRALLRAIAYGVLAQYEPDPETVGVPTIKPADPYEEAARERGKLMWIFRYQLPADNRLRELRYWVDGSIERALTGDPHEFASKMANEKGVPVMWTQASVGVSYHWAWTDPQASVPRPLWRIVWPGGNRTPLVVEWCPHGAYAHEGVEALACG